LLLMMAYRVGRGKESRLKQDEVSFRMNEALASSGLENHLDSVSCLSETRNLHRDTQQMQRRHVCFSK
jgi:hypothetical protein